MGHKQAPLGQGATLQTSFLGVLLFAPDDPIGHVVFREGFGERAMLGAVDLIDWADEGDLERAALRILPVVGQFMSDPGLMRIILGNNLSGRLRAFIKGRELSAETLRHLLADLILASVPPSAESADIRSARFNAKHHLVGYSAPPGVFRSAAMNVLVFASRKGGSGKSTLAAHLAAHVHKASQQCLLIDGDPQGSLALWNKLRESNPLPLKIAQRGFADILKTAKRDGVKWAFIDTAPNLSASVTEAIRCATLAIIPCRPGVFDLDAVKETIGFARQVRTPYAVVVNAAPPKRQDTESPMVRQARDILAEQRVPVWGGQITQRANFSLALAEGEGAKEYESASQAAAEIGRLWLAIERSVKAIHGLRQGAAMHRVAA
jgi:chromosome partitioning protein